MLSTTLIGKKETFQNFGIPYNQRIELDYVIRLIREQVEKEYYDTYDIGDEIRVGLEAIKNSDIDNRPWREVLNEI